MSEPVRETEQWLAEALAATADVLYDVWRCNTDDERRALGKQVGRTLDLYQKHPAHLLNDARTAVDALPEHRLVSWVESSVGGGGTCACGWTCKTDGYDSERSLNALFAAHSGSEQRSTLGTREHGT